MTTAMHSERRRTHQRLSRAGKPYEQRDKSKANGEGSIYFHEAKQLWRATVSLPDGKRKYLSGRTRQDVAAKLTRTLRDLQQGIAPADDRQTVGAWLRQYVDGLEAQKVAHNTVVRYRGIVEKYLDPHFGRMRLAQLQPQQIKAYQDELSRGGVPAASITLHRTILSGALKQAVTFGIVPRNVVTLVKPPRDDREPKGRMLEPEQARSLLETVRADRLEAFYLVLLTAGLRRGEALGLRWADLQLDGPHGGLLHVRHQLQWPKGKPTLVPVKSRKGVRSIPLPSMTVLALRERQMAQQAERRSIGEDGWRAADLVFNSEDGAPLHRNTITNQFHARVKAAGLGHLRPHDLRHTYGSLLMSQGVPLKTISELLGHASIEVTADIYLHSLDVQVRDTAQSVEKALAAPAPRDGRCPTCRQPLLEVTG
jgi:integrase